MKRIFASVLICILIAACVFLCALPNRSAVSIDHDCTERICLICLVYALSGNDSGRLLLLAISSLLTLVLSCNVLLSHIAKVYAPQNTPVYLKVKLLN